MFLLLFGWMLLSTIFLIWATGNLDRVLAWFAAAWREAKRWLKRRT